jgi:hypothetical protein
MKSILKVIKEQSLYITLSVIVLIQVFLLLFNGETYGGADNVGHFQLARYSFIHPELLLDLWGKPVYTFLLAPFTLLGYAVAKSFNLILAVFTLALSAKFADKIFKGSSLPIVILVAFSPVYFFLMITCLTEVLFSLTLVAAVYLFYKEKFALSAIVLSFIPFVRSEGMVLFPVFALAFLLKNKYKPIFLLSVGTIFYSIVGFLVYGDLLWILHRFPYSMGESVYGSGSLFHFVKTSNFIFGVPFLILLVLGIVYWLYQIFRKFSLKDDNLILFIVVTGSWLGYFVAHSYAWWQGTGGSLGLTRVIGAVIPLAAITAVKGIQCITENIKNRQISSGIIVLLSAAQVFMLFNRYDMPTKVSSIDQLVQKSVGFLKQSSIEGKVFYFNPEFVFHLGIDPSDQSKCNWGIADKERPSNSMNYGDIMIWDAHFGSNEGGVLLDNLQKDSLLLEIKTFLPVEKVQVLGGYDYSIRIFKKVASKKNLDTIKLSNKIEKSLSFEGYSVPEVVAVNDFKVWEMKNNQEFSPNIIFPVNELKRYELLEFNLTLQFKTLEPILKDQVLLIFSVDNDNIHLRYEKADLVSTGTQDWQIQTMNIKMPASIPESSKVGVYIWNKDKKHFFIKSLIVNSSSY